MSTEPFVIERTYNAPIDAVWQALTNRDKMAEWYFDLEAFKPEVGFEFEFTGGKEVQYLHKCKILEVVPGKKLSHTWVYDGHPGASVVTFELFDEGDQTRLKLTHTGLETFDPNNGDFARENFEKGWTSIIGTNLKNYLEKV